MHPRLGQRSTTAPLPRDHSTRRHRMRPGAAQGRCAQAFPRSDGYPDAAIARAALAFDGAQRVIENIIGWGSTLILIATLGAQIGKELASGKANNVSPWLFVGQCAASLGFLIYSVLV